MDLRGTRENAAGVSSFGYSGTIAHVVACTACACSRSSFGSCTQQTFRRRRFVLAQMSSSGNVSCDFFSVQWEHVVRPSTNTCQLHMLYSFSPTQCTYVVPSRRTGQVLLFLTCANTLTWSFQSLHVAHALCEQLVSHEMPRCLTICSVSNGASSGAGTLFSCAAHGGASALLRVVRLEHPHVGAQSLLTGTSARISPYVALARWYGETEMAVHRVNHYAARLLECQELSQTKGKLDSGAYVISGGVSGLGLCAATLLNSKGVIRLFLTSRGGRISFDTVTCYAASMATLKSTAVSVSIVSCDHSVCQDTSNLFDNHSFTGALHASGSHVDVLFRTMTSGHVFTVAAPKAVAASQLRMVLHRVSLEVVGFFSSLASVLGNVGQSNYAMANSYLDALAQAHRMSGTCFASFQIPAVTGVGMSANQFNEMQLHAIGAIPMSCFVMCLHHVLSTHQVACVAMIPPELANLPGRATCRCQWYASLGARQRSTLTIENSSACNENAVLRVVQELAGTHMAAPTVETPIMEAGIDSLAATELAAQLRALAGVPISPTVIFDQPTPRAIAKHVQAQTCCSDNDIVSTRRSTAFRATSDLHLALTSFQSRWPGGCNQPDMWWRLQVSSGDAVNEIPLGRWSSCEPDTSQQVKNVPSCTYDGGFITGVCAFSCSTFHISPAETAAMDPQQRLLLEISYSTLHDSSLRRAILVSSDKGVLLGIEQPDWMLVQPPSARSSVFAATCCNVSVAAGRISFTLGLHGPCFSIDAACASSLVAVHGASRAVLARECEDSLGLAISLKLFPMGSLIAASAGMLSPDGRCKTFDARANGYIRSEAVCSTLVGSRCQLGLGLLGSVVKQDGRSASLTAPNGSAQRTLLNATMERSAVHASDLGCIEAHGTGTALGDPTEITALNASFHRPGSGTQLIVGAVKACIGHGEATAGFLGLHKVMDALHHKEVCSNAQLRAMNPLIHEVVEVSEVIATQNVQADCMTGVSAFGYSGTLAHCVVQKTVVAATGALLNDRNWKQSKLKLVYRRQQYQWQSPVHPLLQASTARQGSAAAIFRSPARNHALHALVANHVVQERILFPGAGYLEMARAAAADARVALRGVFFLQPLVVQASLCMHVECMLSSSLFEVRSMREDELDSPVIHCSGAVHPTTTGQQELVVAQSTVRCRLCVHAAHTHHLYDGFDSVGLQYGPAYRTLTQAWGSSTGAAARLMSRSTRDHAQVHPADLDDALCTRSIVTACDTGSSRETQLPFALDHALLQCTLGRLWAVRPR